MTCIGGDADLAVIIAVVDLRASGYVKQDIGDGYMPEYDCFFLPMVILSDPD